MLGNLATTINATATSSIEEFNDEKILCTFTGYVDTKMKRPNISKSIADIDLYNENKAIARQDEDKFEEYLMGLVQ